MDIFLENICEGTFHRKFETDLSLNNFQWEINDGMHLDICDGIIPQKLATDFQITNDHHSSVIWPIFPDKFPKESIVGKCLWKNMSPVAVPFTNDISFHWKILTSNQSDNTLENILTACFFRWCIFLTKFLHTPYLPSKR